MDGTRSSSHFPFLCLFLEVLHMNLVCLALKISAKLEKESAA
jgi:hypothetical protein